MYHILVIAKSKKGAYLLGDFMREFKQTSIATRVIDDFDNFLDGKYDDMAKIKVLYNELNIPDFINEAIFRKVREYHRKYFTTESVDLISEYLNTTENAGKLVSEYFNTE